MASIGSLIDKYDHLARVLAIALLTLLAILILVESGVNPLINPAVTTAMGCLAVLGILVLTAPSNAGVRLLGVEGCFALGALFAIMLALTVYSIRTLIAGNIPVAALEMGGAVIVGIIFQKVHHALSIDATSNDVNLSECTTRRE